MIAQLLLTIAILAGLMAGYYLVQRSLRRVSPEVTDACDVLETRWGCGGCMFHGHCALEPEDEAPPAAAGPPQNAPPGSRPAAYART